jgi:hypothetical protein
MRWIGADVGGVKLRWRGRGEKEVGHWGGLGWLVSAVESPCAGCQATLRGRVIDIEYGLTDEGAAFA